MSGVLIDTSAWVHYLRGTDQKTCDTVQSLLQRGKACTTGVVVAELVSGARNEHDKKELVDAVMRIEFLQTTEPSWWKAGEYKMLMARKGFTTGLPDMVIAATAIHYEAELFSLDRHFEKIAEYIPLRLYGS